MKATYIKPETKTYRIETKLNILTGSEKIQEGNTYGNGDVILAPNRGGNNAIWADKDEKLF